MFEIDVLNAKLTRSISAFFFFISVSLKLVKKIRISCTQAYIVCDRQILAKIRC